MQDLRITLVQANQAWEDKTANFNNYTRLLLGVESDLIILPEMFQTGFSMNAGELAEDFENSESINWLRRKSKELNAAIYTSVIIRENMSNYNRGVFVFPDGNLKTYDKRKRFALAGEDKYYSAGSTETIVEFKSWKINLQICYDLRFPELIRNRMENGQPAYDLLLYVANWPERRRKHWITLLNARAIENQCYVAGVNRCGEDGKGIIYSGDSAVYDPFGEQVISCDHEEATSAVINFSVLAEIREKLPFLNDR
jgi:predicted amidohydrolase